MKQNKSFVSAGNSSVAWFKLAQLVSRGEKEKALNLYRLLSHSFDEKAYALQVEGDILWAFEDDGAIQKYAQAAFLYKKEQNISAAIALYEYLLSLQPHQHEYMHNLIVLYARLGWPEKLKDRFSVLLERMENKEVSSATVWQTVEEAVVVLSKKQKMEKRESNEAFRMLTDVLDEKIPHLAEKAQKLYSQRAM